MNAEEVDPPIYIAKYLSSFQNKLPSDLQLSYAAFTELSLSDQAILDGLIMALAPKAGGVLAAYELVSRLAMWLAKQPKVR